MNLFSSSSYFFTLLSLCVLSLGFQFHQVLVSKHLMLHGNNTVQWSTRKSKGCMHRPLYTGHELPRTCPDIFVVAVVVFSLRDSQCLSHSRNRIGKSIFFPAANELGGGPKYAMTGLSSAGLLPRQRLACNWDLIRDRDRQPRARTWGCLRSTELKKCEKGFGENWRGSQSQSGHRAVSAGLSLYGGGYQGRYWVSLSLQKKKSRAAMGLLGTASTQSG